MTIELKILAWSVLLGIVHLYAQSRTGTRIRGIRWNMGSRDETVAPLQGVAGRLERASRNFQETFPLFAASVLMAHVTDTHNALTFWGAQLYFWGRILYLPLYASGVRIVRTLVWTASTIGILLILIAVLRG
jgi:uncharacterized MAPEG superfamily protein